MEFGVAQILFVHPLALWPRTRSVSSNSVSSPVTWALCYTFCKISVSVKCMSSTQLMPGMLKVCY